MTRFPLWFDCLHLRYVDHLQVFFCVGFADCLLLSDTGVQ